MSLPKRNVFVNFQHDQKAQTVENTGAQWRFTCRHVPLTLVLARSDGSAIVWVSVCSISQALLEWAGFFG
jgi:hypothetical protein